MSQLKHLEAIQRAPLIPSPPRRSEYYKYLGKQKLRSVALVLFIVSIGSVYGIWAVFSKSLIWYPFLVTLAVMIPWMAYIIVLQTYRPRITWDSHQLVKQAGAYMLKHSVDVLIPVCGEDPVVVRNTIYHVRRMSWSGRLRIYVCDDGNSPVIRDMADRFGVVYLVRPDRPLHKKSGNLNWALGRTSGEFVAVFDADFAPAPEFLTETMPYMLYENLGIVQTSQYFDVKMMETRNWIQQLSGSTQDMFFCWAQPARNAADAAMCVGTNVVYRRKALEATNGFPRVEGGGEDVITGLDFYTAGYRTLYVPLNLAKGVCPDTFEAAVNQQYRWALSSMKMFIGTNGHSESFRRAPLTLKQRFVFWSGALYYTQSVLVLLLAVLPSLVMFWFFPYDVYPGNYLPIAPAMLGMFALPTIIRGWRPSTLRLIVVYSVAHLLAVIDVILNTGGDWVPTGAVNRKHKVPERAGHVVRWWVAASQAAMWVALAKDIPVYGWANYYPAVACTLFQTIILAPLILPGYGTLAQFSLLPHLFMRNRRTRKAQADVV